MATETRFVNGTMSPDAYVCSDGVTHYDRDCSAAGAGYRSFCRNAEERGSYECFECGTENPVDPTQRYYRIPAKGTGLDREFAGEIPTDLDDYRAGFNRHTRALADRYRRQQRYLESLPAPVVHIHDGAEVNVGERMHPRQIRNRFLTVVAGCAGILLTAAAICIELVK